MYEPRVHQMNPWTSLEPLTGFDQKLHRHCESKSVVARLEVERVSTSDCVTKLLASVHVRVNVSLARHGGDVQTILQKRHRSTEDGNDPTADTEHPAQQGTCLDLGTELISDLQICQCQTSPEAGSPAQRVPVGNDTPTVECETFPMGLDIADHDDTEKRYKTELELDRNGPQDTNTVVTDDLRCSVGNQVCQLQHCVEVVAEVVVVGHPLHEVELEEQVLHRGNDEGRQKQTGCTKKHLLGNHAQLAVTEVSGSQESTRGNEESEPSIHFGSAVRSSDHQQSDKTGEVVDTSFVLLCLGQGHINSGDGNSFGESDATSKLHLRLVRGIDELRETPEAIETPPMLAKATGIGRLVREIDVLQAPAFPLPESIMHTVLENVTDGLDSTSATSLDALESAGLTGTGVGS
ncbi:hypothetical protein KCU65_g477, partial [Aureobasidium melanogenum]